LPDHKDDHKHMEEHREEHKEHAAKKESVAVKKSTLMIVSFTIIALAVGIAAGFLIGQTQGKPAASTTPNKDIAVKVIDFLNNNLVQPGTNASFVSMTEKNGLLEITTLYQGNNIPIYASTDGSMIFLSQPVLTNETIQTTTPKATEIPKTDKASAELFVMAFCPYGVQAEGVMKPVVDLLGSKADIKIRFITNVGGTTPDSVQSLHGANEAMEDLRQVCIMKYYPDKYWSYLSQFDANCYSKSQDSAGLEACWKATASNFSIDTAKIATCANSTEAIDLLKTDEAASNVYGASASPTLIINGVEYQGARSSDAFRQAICSGFTNPPAECSQAVNTPAGSATAQGNCG
jgi:Thioredoxin